MAQASFAALIQSAVTYCKITWRWIKDPCHRARDRASSLKSDLAPSLKHHINADARDSCGAGVRHAASRVLSQNSSKAASGEFCERTSSGPKARVVSRFFSLFPDYPNPSSFCIEGTNLIKNLDCSFVLEAE